VKVIKDMTSGEDRDPSTAAIKKPTGICDNVARDVSENRRKAKRTNN
jgi:hypothetical protein